MREALPGSINGQGGLTNSGEVVILYTWDGASDLVQDIDYAVWGDKAEAVDKTSVEIDGPDGDGDRSFYLSDTAIADQDVVAIGGHATGDSFQRVDFNEGVETQSGGNGITGSDETSEDLSVTWSQLAVTPGAAPPEPPEPPVVAVVINEIIQNPAAVSDNNGEWFELVNATPDPVDVEGWTFRDNGSNFHVISSGGPLVIPAGGFLVLGRDNDPATNGGVTVDYQYSNTFLGNGSDALILVNSAGGEVDRVEWDNGSSFPDPTGASMALKNPALDNSVGANWCESQTPFGDGDLGTPGAGNDCFAGLVINEVDADDTGSDDEEFIEIYDGGAGNTDLSGLSIVLYNGSDDQTYDAFDLDGYATGVDGFFVLGSVVGNDLFVAPGWLQNGADAVTLYAGDAIDFGNDTPLTFDGLLDAVVYDTNDSDDAGLLVLLNGGQPQVNENGAGAKDIHSNQRCPNGFGGQRNTDAYIQDVPTPGSLNTCPPLAISSIQGAGPASPYAGFIVSLIDGVVTAVAADGFFVQTVGDGDGDSETSDAVFVFTGGAPGVAVGDLVDVAGEVSEFFGFTEIGGSPTVTVKGTGVVPAPIVFDATVPSPDPLSPSCSLEFECYEGMLIEIVNGTVTGPNQRFGSDPVAEVHITAASARTFREPGIEYPGLNMPPIPTWDGNPEVFELDPDRLGLPNQIIPAGSSFSATGVLGYEFGGYEFWPTSLDVTPATLPKPVRAREAGELTVGTLNLFRLFDDVDDPMDGNRNDFVVSAEEYQRRLSKFSGYIRTVLGAPDILAVQEVESLRVLEDLAAAISFDSAGAIAYTAQLIEGNDIGTIDVGFLVRENINVDAISQVDPAVTFINPITFDNDILHDRPPLLLEGDATLQFGTYPIAVMVVHNRSLGGIDGDQALRVRVKRLLQAESIAMKVQDLQNANPEVRLVVTGDFNDFEFTDGYVDALGIITGNFDPLTSLVCSDVSCLGDVVEPNLDNQVLWVPDDQRYSFIFGGSAQVLDHALTSAKLTSEISGVMFGRGNADAAVDLINDGGLLRSSDHDGLVIYVSNDDDADGVPNDDDFCPATVLPELVPVERLGTNRFADTDGDGVFETTAPKGKGPKKSFDLGDTAGCSCEQIIEAQGLGKGHTKFGCSIGVMKNWVSGVTP